jgi:hypothetical protein
LQAGFGAGELIWAGNGISSGDIIVPRRGTWMFRASGIGSPSGSPTAMFTEVQIGGAADVVSRVQTIITANGGFHAEWRFFAAGGTTVNPRIFITGGTYTINRASYTLRASLTEVL